MASALIDAVVIAPFQVVVDGVSYGPGQTAQVLPALASQWRSYGWVTCDALPPEPDPNRAMFIPSPDDREDSVTVTLANGQLTGGRSK